jgi:predicted phosphoribosyltransferase
MLIEDNLLRDLRKVFSDRREAGERLAAALRDIIRGDEMVLAIPSGGVPVAREIARAYSLPLELLLVRKLQVPGNPEAGFGAMDPDGIMVLNERLIKGLELEEEEIAGQSEKTLSVIRHRDAAFRGGRPFPDLAGRRVIITDDGLASGYTMLSAVRFARRRGPALVMAAVPTAQERSALQVLGEVDILVCLNMRAEIPYAVADAYVNWYDLSDEEVVSVMESNGN